VVYLCVWEFESRYGRVHTSSVACGEHQTPAAQPVILSQMWVCI
jgi:hypothetical protein